MKKFLCVLISVFLILLTALSVSVTADNMPDWYYKGDPSNFSDFHGENLPLVVDNADVLTDSEEAALNRRMAEVVDEYGIGYVLLTDNSNYGLSPEYYSSDFLHFCGYGVGEDYGAVVFYISFEPSNRCWRTTAINSYMDIFTQSVMYDIDETVDADIRAGRYYEAFLKHIDFVEDLFAGNYEGSGNRESITSARPKGIAGIAGLIKRFIPQGATGIAGLIRGFISDDEDEEESVSRSDDYSSESFPVQTVLIIFAFSIVAGIIAGAVHLAICRKGMRVVAPVGAREYLVKDSFVLRDKNVVYLYSTVTKTPRPKSNGSSGGSSFSSGSSSGGSFSSGGRSF